MNKNIFWLLVVLGVILVYTIIKQTTHESASAGILKKASEKVNND